MAAASMPCLLSCDSRSPGNGSRRPSYQQIDPGRKLLQSGECRLNARNGGHAMSVLHWKTGVVGPYLDPANWVEGVAPGPGDTAIIADPSGPTFYPAGVNPSFLSSLGLSAPPGNAIVGQTIDFTPTTDSTT